MSGPLYLFKTRRFAPLFGVQFLGALNDNVFKNTLAVILTFQAAQWTTLSSALLAPLVGAVFILPFFLFSGFAGEVADMYDKARLSRFVKVWEIVLMMMAVVGFLFHSLPLLLCVVFGMGVHSTVFGPIKYAIIPQHMEDNELIAANALVESGTFIAILLGTILGGIFSSLENGGVIASVLGVVLAVIGYVISRYIPTAPTLLKEVKFSLNIFRQTLNSISIAYKNYIVFISIIAISWFWLFGAMLLSQFPTFAKTVLHGDETTVTLLLAIFTLGIGVGSVICERLSHHHVRLSLVLAGGVGMGVAGIDFALSGIAFSQAGDLFSDITFYHLLGDLFVIGVSGGIYSVPLYALLQSRSEAQKRSRTIAANNIFNALFMVGGAVGVMMCMSYGVTTLEIFFALGVLTLVMSAIVWFLLNKKSEDGIF